MKYLDEFGDPELARRLLDDIAATATRPWALMEVCGGQTHTIIRNGIDQLLPEGVEMIHGPGCPVCVTPLETIDRALAIAATPGVIFCSFGDMIRVPGSEGDLFRVKSAGGDVRIVYSPLDAVRIAAENPDKQVVFFGIGFETTAPANAMTVQVARRQGITNFSLLVSHVLVPPAITAIMESPSCRVQGFLAAGHVCTVMGMAQYEPLVAKYRVPIVVTGFEPLDVLEGIRRAVHQLEEGRAELENAYPRAVAPAGNPVAQGCGRGGLHRLRPGVARHRRDPAVRVAALGRVRRVRCRGPVRCRGHRHDRVGAVPGRRGAPGPDQAVPVRGVRHGVHAEVAVGRTHGLQRGRVCRLLPVPSPGAARMSEPLDITSWSCPMPLRDHPNVVMGHGGGGRLSAELIEHLFLPAFDGTPLADVLTQLGDAAVLDLPGADRGVRLAFTTDSYVVRPRFFPGGNIGDLAVNGTVNDLAVSGALPLALSVGAILEEGMALDELGIIAETMGAAARAAGVSIVTGDTKVVDSGHGDGVYLNTAGIGLVPAGPGTWPGSGAPR